jgi:hypothetical protein
MHSYLNDYPAGYHMENKWTFLEKGERVGVPVSPFLKVESIVCKHRNEEGGMGIHFFKNATAGGDWIIQERIENAPWVQKMLPSNAPLSTFRVITMSRASLDVGMCADGKAKIDDIEALSCVFRAGRGGALTDHDSILFDIDTKTGIIKDGNSNAHWYKLGVPGALGCSWRNESGTKKHPDGNIPIAGEKIPDIKDMLDLVRESHVKMCPDVPLVGWDVVYSTDKDRPINFLEVNLSCNFFKGSFDKDLYMEFISHMWDNCDEIMNQRRESEVFFDNQHEQ